MSIVDREGRAMVVGEGTVAAPVHCSWQGIDSSLAASARVVQLS